MEGVIMSEERNRWIDAIVKMIELTQKGDMKWEARDSTHVREKDDDSVEAVFYTKYEGKSLRLYKLVYTAYKAVSPTTLYDVVIGAAQKKEAYRTSKIILDFVSEEGFKLWTYPEVNALPDLLSAVQYQTAGINDFIDALLNDDKELSKDNN